MSQSIEDKAMADANVSDYTTSKVIVSESDCPLVERQSEKSAHRNQNGIYGNPCGNESIAEKSIHLH
jgi:hypothetical protein